VKNLALLHPNPTRRPITAGQGGTRFGYRESSFAEVFTRRVIEKKTNEKNIN
jgi:arsenate reductase-like glutaredoxin family protein